MLFFIVGISSLTVIGTYSYFTAKRAILKRTLDQLTSIRVIKKRQLEFLFSEQFKKLEFLSNTKYIRNLPEQLANTDTQSLALNESQGQDLEMFPEITSYQGYGFSNMYIIPKSDSDKKIIYAVINSLIVPFEGDPKIREMLLELYDKSILSDSIYIMDFVKLFPADNDPVFLISKCITDHNRNFNGLLAVQIPVKAINDVMLEDSRENGLGESGEVYLVGRDLLMRSNSRFIPNSVMQTTVNTGSVSNAFSNQAGSALIDDYRTIACLSSYDRISINGLDWAIIAEIDYDEAMIPIVSIRNDMLFLSAVIIILLFSVAHFISRSITHPIIKLKNAALRIGEGIFESNLKASSRDEIGLLTDAFNTMSAQLKEERANRMRALYDGQELERQRISRELHDGLGQKLVAIKLMLESTSKQVQDEARQTIDEVKIEFFRLIEEVREISNNLAPNVLTDSGIDVAIKNLCLSVKRTACIAVDFSSYGDFNPGDKKINSYIFRIAQEGLNNAVKHSGAKKIHVQLLRTRENFILVIEDNGKGFNYNSSHNKGNGLYNMKERAALINASIDIETMPGEGTTIRLKIPFS